jgi:serine/threonine protein kinase
MDYNHSFIFIKPNRCVEESFYYFIRHSTITLLSDSSAFGFVFRCRFTKKPEKSPYFYLNIKNETQDVQTIVIKCLLVNDRISSVSESAKLILGTDLGFPLQAKLATGNSPNLCDKDGDDNNHYWNYKRTSGKVSKRHFDMMERFKEEVHKQTVISKEGLAAMNRNCPVALFSKLYGDRSLKGKILGKMILKRCATKDDKMTLKKMLDELSFRQNMFSDRTLNYYFGIFAMEYVESSYQLFNDIVKPIIIDDIVANHPELYKYDSLALSPHSERLRWAYNTVRYELLRMALDTGYSHGDYHTDNMLICEKTRRSMIIDFGRCKKIADHNPMLDLWHNNSSDKSLSSKKWRPDFHLLLKILFYSTFTDDKRHDEFMWVKGIDEEDIDILIFLHKMHKAPLEKQRIDHIYDMINDTTTFNGVCTVDNHSRIYKGSTLWSNILEYTFYGFTHTYLSFRHMS